MSQARGSISLRRAVTFWSAVINGVVAVPLMVVIMLMAMRSGRDGPFRPPSSSLDDGLALHSSDGDRGRDYVRNVVVDYPPTARRRRAAAPWTVARGGDLGPAPTMSYPPSSQP